MSNNTKRKFVHCQELDTIPEEYPINPLFKNFYHLYGDETDNEELDFLFADGLLKLYTANVCKKINIDPDFDYVQNFNRLQNDTFNFSELKAYVNLSVCKHSTEFNSGKSSFLDSPKMDKLIFFVTSSETSYDFIHNSYRDYIQRPLSNYEHDEFINDGLILALKTCNLYEELCKIKDDLSLGNDFTNKKLFPINNGVRTRIKNTLFVDLGRIYLRWSSILEKKNNYAYDNIKSYSKSRHISVSIFLTKLQSIFLDMITDYVNKSLLCMLFQINFTPNFQNYAFMTHVHNLISSVNKNKDYLLKPISCDDIYSAALPNEILAELYN